MLAHINALANTISRIQAAIAHLKADGIKTYAESTAIDWCNLELGEYPIWHLELRLPGRVGMDYQLVTHITWDRKPGQRLPQLWWNSDHLAWHLCNRTVNHSGVDGQGQEQDVTEYQARPLWGLLGEHTFTW